MLSLKTQKKKKIDGLMKSMINTEYLFYSDIFTTQALCYDKFISIQKSITTFLEHFKKSLK